MTMSDLNTPLSSDEFASLKAVKAGRLIPKKHQERLTQLKLIEQKLGGLGLTSAGELRVGMGK